jgi:type IV pilus biogenesis protein CpaD/CtpE
MDEQDLCDELKAWCDRNSKEQNCALEMLMFDHTLTDKQRAQLENFSQRWEDMLVDEGARRAVEMA